MAPFSANATPHAQPNERHAEVASSVQYEDPFEKENARFQIAWNTVMDNSGHYKTPSFYKKVSCLLVSWDKACDDLHTDEESKVVRKWPPRPYSLWVGALSTSTVFRLTGCSKRKLSENPGEVNEIVWGRIEDNFQDTKADVLEGSFTTALIWALEALVEKQSKFLVSELTCKIREAPGFPKEQVPVQLDRCSRSLERIILAPLLESSDQGDSTFVDSHVSGPQGLLNLNFIFKEVPTMDLIKDFGWSLNRFVWKSGMPVSRIAWGGLTSWEGVQPSSGANAIKLDAVKAFKQAGDRRRSLRMKHTRDQIVLPGVAAPLQGADLLSPSPTPSSTSQPSAQKRRKTHA
ncbi:MAG: hypothetical protein Q9191_007398 [Dirinaria sp. TL-2023a]